MTETLYQAILLELKLKTINNLGRVMRTNMEKTQQLEKLIQHAKIHLKEKAREEGITEFFWDLFIRSFAYDCAKINANDLFEIFQKNPKGQDLNKDVDDYNRTLMTEVQSSERRGYMGITGKTQDK